MAGTNNYSATHYHDSHGHEHRKPTAEELAAMAYAVDMERWITYKPIEPFEEWLSNNLPSQTTRLDGISWICVRSPLNIISKSDYRGAALFFEKLKSSGVTINQQSITKLAQMYSVTAGKWLFYSPTGLQVDHLWRIIARGVVSGKCGMSAKVNAYDPNASDDKHVVCVYNSDFTNQEEVMDLEKSIRNLGLKCVLMYKPDIYTILGIYRNNEWSLPPTIYRSVFDLKKRSFIVSTRQ